MAKLHPIAAAAALALSLTTHAQDTTLRAVTVTPAASPPADVTGFGDFPLREVPISASVIRREQLESLGARRLADLTVLDAAVTDAYNAPGYWDFLSIRGFTLDNRFNYRREGLPINAQTSIPLDNKERVEILKGTSGIQAGTSAPGGLVNYVVKRPTQQPVRSIRLEATQRASLLAAADLGNRFGNDSEFGLRLNVAQERLRPQVRNLDGERSLLAAAGDWRLSRDSLVEAEVEWSRKTQPSQAAFSLLGNTLPAPVDPRLNLNNQPWAQPSVFEGLTGTLRFEQAINSQWRWSLTGGRQSLRTDDREAFPFGCGAESAFDRYCSDGTFDLYDFRSENERRRQDAVQAALKGKFTTGAVSHDLTLSLLNSRVRNRFEQSAFNFAGIGNLQGTVAVPPAPDLVVPNTDLDERSTEVAVQDAMRWNDRLTTWAGVRHTRLQRESIRTDGTQPTDYSQGLTTPWLAVSYKLLPSTSAYASWGQGVESQVVPNVPVGTGGVEYTNAGQPLPSLKSRQVEVGFKGGSDALGWQVAAFRIERPVSSLDACARLFLTPCTVTSDGEAVHQGVEASAQWTTGPWRLGGSAMVLDAKRQGSTVEPAVNGTRPTNVPRTTLRAQAGYRFAAVPGLSLDGRLSHESSRSVVPGGAIQLPSWTRMDAALRYDVRLNGTQTSWTIGIDNIADRRYWKESPTQFSHLYLYPGAPRTVRLAFTASL